MANELMTSGDLGPWNLCVWWTRAMATKAVILLELLFVNFYYIDQPTMSDGAFKALCEIRILAMEPLSNRLVCVARSKSSNDLPVVAIATDGLQYCPLPGSFFPQTSVICVQSICIISYLAIVILEVGIILS